MGQQKGSTSKIIIDTETIYKTTPATPAAMVLPFTRESLRLKRGLSSSKTIRLDRNPQKPMRGKVDVSGDINFELSPQCGRVLKHVFGSYAKIGTAAPYTHQYKIGNLPPGLCVEKQFLDLDTPKYFLYNGNKINQFNMSVGPDAIEAGISLLGAKETINASSFDAAPTDLGHTPFDSLSASIKQGGVPLAIATGINFNHNNGLDGDTYVIDGTLQRYSLNEGEVAVGGSLQALFESDTLYNLAVNHSETSLEIDFQLGNGTGESAGNEKLSFFFDEMVFEPQSPIIEGPKGLSVDLAFIAFYNDGANASACRAVLLSPIAVF